jgi:hypothetical protein
MTFFERVGGVLVAPRAALSAAAARSDGRGATDAAWLIAAKLLAGELPRLVRAGVRGIELGLGAALQGVLMTLQEALPDVILVMLGGLVMSMFSGPRPAGNQRPAEAIDVAAYAFVPYLAVQLAGALLYTALGHPPSHRATLVLRGVGLVWAAAVWTIGLRELRHARARAT